MQIYRTSCLALAALLSMSLPIESIDRSDARRMWFSFSRTDDLDRYVEAYYRREVNVEPQGYFESIKAMKTRLYDAG